MQDKYWIFLIMLLIFSISACKNSRLEKLVQKEGAYLGKVEVSAGDDIDYLRSDTLNFMAFPMNVITLAEKKKEEKIIYLIGKSLDRGSLVAFKPVALMNTTKADNSQEKIVIARPLDETLLTANVNTYFELISVHYGIQKMIETWEKNSRGFGSVKSISWENEEIAEEYLKY